jgi:long-chain acyl-CoA synthetase
VLDPTWPPALRMAAQTAVEATALPADRMVLFTSGSSGRPRGVVRTVASWRDSVRPLSELTGIGPDDVVWLPGSPASTLTLYAGWHAHAVGAQVRGASGWPRGTAPVDATALHAAPRVLESAVTAAERGQLPNVRVAVVAGDALPSELRRRVAGLGWGLVEYYGAAELSFVAWRPDSSAYQRFPGVEVQIRDSEIWARSPYLCERYLTEDESGPLRRAGDWATVGDLGRLEDDGLQVLGRGDAAVTTGGRTVVVEDGERSRRDSALSPDRLMDVVASSIPHPLLGELLVAVVLVGPDGARLTREELDQAVAELPDWSRPRRWWLVGDLPRTSSGKPDRAAVRAGLADASLTARPLR